MHIPIHIVVWADHKGNWHQVRRKLWSERWLQKRSGEKAFDEEDDDGTNILDVCDTQGICDFFVCLNIACVKVCRECECLLCFG